MQGKKCENLRLLLQLLLPDVILKCLLVNEPLSHLCLFLFLPTKKSTETKLILK